MSNKFAFKTCNVGSILSLQSADSQLRSERCKENTDFLRQGAPWNLMLHGQFQLGLELAKGVVSRFATPK